MTHRKATPPLASPETVALSSDMKKEEEGIKASVEREGGRPIGKSHPSWPLE